MYFKRLFIKNFIVLSFDFTNTNKSNLKYEKYLYFFFCFKVIEKRHF